MSLPLSRRRDPVGSTPRDPSSPPPTHHAGRGQLPPQPPGLSDGAPANRPEVPHEQRPTRTSTRSKTLAELGCIGRSGCCHVCRHEAAWMSGRCRSPRAAHVLRRVRDLGYQVSTSGDGAARPDPARPRTAVGDTVDTARSHLAYYLAGVQLGVRGLQKGWPRHHKPPLAPSTSPLRGRRRRTRSTSARSMGSGRASRYAGKHACSRATSVSSIDIQAVGGVP